MESSSGVGVGSLIAIFVLLLLAILILVTRAEPRRAAMRLRALNARRRELAGHLDAMCARYGGVRTGEGFGFQHDGLSVQVMVKRDFEGAAAKVHLQIAGLAPIELRTDPQNRGGWDVTTGEPDFDGFVRVSGDVGMALALLTPQTRGLVHRALLAGFQMTVRNGQGILGIATYSDDIDLITPHIEPGLQLAQQLRPPTDVYATLITRLREEPRVTGRLDIAIQLPPAVADDPARLRELVAHPEPEVRLALAMRLDLPELWATLPEPTLITLLGSERPATVQQAMVALGRYGTVDAVPALKLKKTELETANLATDTILAIQERATGAPGGLALATSDGALSLNE